jgi:lysophospholipase L1-like esterase
MINDKYIKSIFKSKSFQRLNFKYPDENWMKHPENEYSQNSLGLRDDEFENFKEGYTKFLFAGCSMTEGVGLPKKYMWSENVKKHIKETNDKTQFYNIGMGGVSTQLIIKNVVNFIKEYGKPDYIFLMLPDLGRLVEYEDELYFNNVLSKDINLETLFFYDANILMLFEEFCSTNNIKLFLMSWHYQTYKLYNETGLKLYKILDHGLEAIYFTKNIKQYRDPLLFRGSDGVHPGGLWNWAVADMIIKYYEEEKK